VYYYGLVGLNDHKSIVHDTEKHVVA